jgi:F0F1-type ATP synthase membrane subunit b/b'
MDGVPEVAEEQAGIVADAQAAIDASVEEARVALEGELSNMLADGIANMDGVVDELSTGLQDRQADAEAGVVAAVVAAT